MGDRAGLSDADRGADRCDRARDLARCQVSAVAGAWPVTSEWVAEHFPVLLIAMIVIFVLLMIKKGGR